MSWLLNASNPEKDKREIIITNAPLKKVQSFQILGLEDETLDVDDIIVKVNSGLVDMDEARNYLIRHESLIMAETRRDYEQKRRQSLIEEAGKSNISDLIKEEIDYMIAEINYYEACMSSSMSMGSVHEHKEASDAFDALPIDPSRHFAIIRFLNKMLSD